MAVEESHLLAMEKSLDVESCQWQKSSSDDDDLERNCTDSQQVYNTRLWHCLAFALLTLTIISAANNFGYHYRPHVHRALASFAVPDIHAVPAISVPDDEVPISTKALDPTEADISKSMYFNIIGFGDNIGSIQNPLPRQLYKSVGQTVVRDGKAYLTSQITTDENGVVPMPHSVGRLMHPRPFRVKHRGLHPGQERVVSFHTFVFSIKNMLRDNATFAVEFDIRRNPALLNISNNHVGINVHSMVSVLASEAGYWSQDGGADQEQRFNRVDTINGQVQAWIDYDIISQKLTVSISPELGSKPVKPLPAKRLDLTKVLEKYMYDGFSAATGEFSPKHIIHSWKFEKHSNPHPGGFTVPQIPKSSCQSF